MPENAKHLVNAKVVHLEPENQRINRSRLARLPAPVHAVHEKGKHLLKQQFQSFFDRADDSLFELADKAMTNDEQNLYFDSMREVRVQRMGLEKKIFDQIDGAFADLVLPHGAEVRTNQVDQLSVDSLSIVQDDDLEEMVAMETAIKKANHAFGEEVQHMSLRLDSLLPIKVYHKNNPFGPDIICNAFMGQVKRLDVGVKAKMVLFKLFDNSVVNQLGAIYKTLNEVLIDHNVLPSLNTRQNGSGKRQVYSDIYGAQADSLSSDHMPDAGTGNVDPQTLEALQSILHQSNSRGGAQAGSPEINTLMQMLSVAQNLPQVRQNMGVRAIDVRSILSQIQSQQGITAPIGRVDDEIINLVNMLFEFILEDRNLAQPMKAVISRLQIPIIKVALVDKSFFTKGGHVARQLLNEMAKAAIGWQGDHDNPASDPLYKKMESVVHTLSTDFDNNVELFSDLLADFTTFIEKEKRRAAILERRTLDAEDGKAKAEVGRLTVAIEVELRVIDQAIPQVVNDIVNDVWNHVLFVNGLKHGYDSEQWKGALITLEELIWSVQPPANSEERQKLIRLVPALLKKLRAGFDIISFNPFEMSKLFKSLESAHLACIRGADFERSVVLESKRLLNEPSHDAKKDTENPTPAASTSAHSGKSQSNLSAQPSNKGTLKTESGKGDQPDQDTTTLSGPAQQKKVEVNRSSERVSTAKPGSASENEILLENDPAMAQVKQFVQGAWFDFVNHDQSSSRCRLAAYIKPTNKYIFVNRNGMKVAERTQQELALMLKKQQLVALDNSVLFDRALETVVSGLRKK